MNRKFLNGVAGAVLSILAAGSVAAGDYTQLAGSARVSPAEAAAMTLDEIVARKFSREGRDNVQASRSYDVSSAVRSSRTGRTVSLDAYHAAMVNRGTSGDERQIVVEREAIAANPAARGQLVASAGLGGEAEGMTLDTIAGYKFNREADGDNRVAVIQ